MTDLEMTKLCAEAMGYKVVYPNDDKLPVCIESDRGAGVYNPLHIDAQAMALVKRFRLHLHADMRTWWAMRTDGDPFEGPDCEDLNRAIVECVAQSQ